LTGANAIPFGTALNFAGVDANNPKTPFMKRYLLARTDQRTQFFDSTSSLKGNQPSAPGNKAVAGSIYPSGH
jgi:hypothetical protein